MLINLNELNNSSLFRRRKIVTPNAHAAQLRIINNIRMQRACRYSMKKLAINNMVDYSNSQRLFNGLGEGQMPIVGLNEANPNVKGGAGAGGGGGDKADKNAFAGGGVSRTRNNQQQAATRQSSMLAGGKGGGLNNTLMMMGGGPGGGPGGNSDIDFKLFQYKKQQAELKRNQLEDDLKENHPYFDKPLFTIGKNICE